MTLSQLTQLFLEKGSVKLYAKTLAENDNSKNQVYFAGAVEALNVFPSKEIFASNTKKGPGFKASLDFAWLGDDGNTSVAPHAQLILYSQYPEVRFSGFLLGCKNAPKQLMADRNRARTLPAFVREQLPDRVLFLATTADRKVIGYLAGGKSEIAQQFRSNEYKNAFVVFKEIPIGKSDDEYEAMLLARLSSIHKAGWIDSKQLDSSGNLKPCRAPQCGGFTLEAEFGIPKNSDSEPDFHGWEIKQYSVADFDKIVSAKPITLLTPEPDGGFYKTADPEAFIRKFGYSDKRGRIDRMNFGGRHLVGTRCGSTGLTMFLSGFDIDSGMITDAEGVVALLSDSGEVAASWSFAKLFAHWSKKHSKAVYVPSKRRLSPNWQYSFGHTVQLARGTDSLRLMKAFATRAMYYDPGIKLENASSNSSKPKKRSQFRVSSRNLPTLYSEMKLVSVA